MMRSLPRPLRSLAAARPAPSQPLTNRQRALLKPLLVPTALGGILAVLFAIRELAAGLSPGQVAGLVALVAAATLAEAFPVPVGGASTVGGVSLAAVFILGAGLFWGWTAATIVAFCSSVAVQVVERKETRRVAYNAGVYAVAGSLGGLAMQAVGGSETAGVLVMAAVVGSIVFWGINITLVIGAVARVQRARMRDLLAATARETFVPAAVMASTTVMLVSLAQSSPYLPLTLAGPLAAITMYQRTVHSSLTAMKLARTDSLTELGNYRYFSEQLDAFATIREEGELTLSLCLFDLDDFKSINDTHGHPAGDAALRHVASALRQNGEAFRIGGDEFALLLERTTESQARQIVARVMARVADTEFEHGGSVQLSAGIAAYPQDGLDLSELVACADVALYAAKNAGKNQLSCYRPGMGEPAHGSEPGASGGESEDIPGQSRPARAA